MILDRLKSDIKGNITEMIMYKKYTNGTTIYYNPITGKLCTDYIEDNSKTGVNEGCLKWYIFNDNANNATVNMILDHNTTATVAWNSEGTNTEMKEVKTALENDTKNWVNEARLISAEEIAQITNNQTWDSLKSTEFFYFETNTTEPGTTCNSDGNCKYGWLFDRTNKACTNSGCYNDSDVSINGYWTSTKNIGKDNYVWNVGYGGSLGNAMGGGDVTYTDRYGVRPLITIKKEELKLKENTEFVFNYTGKEQTFIVPITGNYKIETWGAQGGNIGSYIGGYGGYSSGFIDLSYKETLYINVGGAGSQTDTGGYNGGGSLLPGQYVYGASGGGATHIATKSGLLSSLESSKESILIVAGGGGGANFRSEGYGEGHGGCGGGFTGCSGTSTNHTNGYGWGYGYGGTQTSGGSRYWTSAYEQDITLPGIFGSASIPKLSVNNVQSGGGGGYYGGGPGTHGAAGGGSSYIGNASLKNKSMYCYNCTESTDTNTKTVSTTNVSEDPISNYAKKGNGYARITYLGDDEYIIPTLVNNENKTSISDGTEKDPYYVSTIEDLVILSNNVNKGNSYENKIIILINDIDFKNKENYLDYTSKEYGDINGDGTIGTIYEELTTSNGFMPIGDEINEFKGTFDGNGKTISNLLINREMPYQALFGNNLGTIKNITVTGNVSGIYRVSGITSYNQGTLINCINRANLKITLVANYEKEDRTYFGGNIGGIAGQNKGTISNSINKGNITSTYKTGTSDNGYTGGITGHNTGKISNSYNEGTIIGISTRDIVTGGITGANYGSAVVTDCYNKGSITSSTTLSTAASFSGGIVGLNRATVLNTYNIGTLKSTGSGNRCAIYNDTNGAVTNSYYLDTCSLGGAGTSKTSTELKAISGTLGSEFKNDTNLINNGYPILKWQ